jgi:hypothetical protein
MMTLKSPMQESTTKGMERAFDVLLKGFDIIHSHVEYWKPKVLWQIMTCCISLHNMITEDDHDMAENFRYISNGDPIEPEHDANMIHRFLTAHQRIENREIHTQMQDDLVEHHRLLHITS